MERRKSLLILFILFISVLIVAIFFGNQVKIEPTQKILNEGQSINIKNTSKIFYKIIRIVDGDTVIANINGIDEKIRLIGVNTPESVDPRKKVECFGKEASEYTKSLLNNSYIEIEFDETQNKRDKYGRIIAYIFREDGLFINKEIILNGYGYEYTYIHPYKYKNEFDAAEKYARENKLGLWKDNMCNK